MAFGPSTLPVRWFALQSGPGRFMSDPGVATPRLYAARQHIRRSNTPDTRRVACVLSDRTSTVRYMSFPTESTGSPVKDRSIPTHPLRVVQRDDDSVMVLWPWYAAKELMPAALAYASLHGYSSAEEFGSFGDIDDVEYEYVLAVRDAS